MSRKYALVTAAHNEELFIHRTLESVVAQTILPVEWVIVSDGSTDRTDEIVQAFARRHSFIRFVRRERVSQRNFGSKVEAVQVGLTALANDGYDFVGNLDADLSFDRCYFEQLLARFEQDEQLGLAGGWIHEDHGSGFAPRPFNETWSVPHAVHFLRRNCYRDIGAYQPLTFGGEDTCAVTEARMSGWMAHTFRDLPVYHHRHSASSGGRLRNHFRLGRMDYSLGYALWYEGLACARRSVQNPLVIGSVVRFGGFLLGYVRRDRRPVSPAFVKFLRASQRGVLRAWLGNLR